VTAGTAAKTDPVRDEQALPVLPKSGAAMAAWFAIVALYAGGLAVFGGTGSAFHDRVWAQWAVGAYALSALVALLWRSRGTDAALLVSLAGALIAPVTWLLTIGPGANETKVLDHAAAMLLYHGTPYLSAAQLAHQTHLTAYNPYLPDMTVFGLPHALGLPGPLGSVTVWLIVVSVVLIVLAFRIAGRPDAARTSLLAITSPMIAFPMSVTITDPPVLGILFLTFALLGRKSRDLPIAGAAILLGVACAMKTTAWLALPLLAAVLVTRNGVRTAIKFSAITAVTTAVLFVAFAPALLVRPADLIQNTVLFPLGLTHIATPAASPVPGHLIASAGPAGHTVAIILLIAAGLTVAAWIVLRPPTDIKAATWRLAVALTLMFALDPGARFGYFDYPLALCGWIALCYGLPLWRTRQATTTGAAVGAMAGSFGELREHHHGEAHEEDALDDGA
jgi:hypothetical protein